MRFSTKKLFGEGQLVELDERWSAVLNARLAPVAHEPEPEDGPDPQLVLTLHLQRSGEKICRYDVIEGSFMFPKKVPKRLREPLFRVQSEAFEYLDDDEKLDKLWETLKKSWPPPRKEWIFL